ncbi:UNVERIFIED_CONTAM: type I restriction-modification enzyme R subunit C-terminal domain-containing protein [Kocuria sp. CPCC 205316]|uniref:type I restriction-modification enzyme R subunit C-terminal domain-containing protein n=1 Tax=Kocuria TaxID=57493 RepID=UPI0036DE5C20
MIDAVVETGSDNRAWTAGDPLRLETARRRLRHGRALTTLALAALEKMLLESGAGPREDLERTSAGELAGFIKSLVGLDPQIVQEAFAEFIAASTSNTRQRKMLNMLFGQLTRGGRMDAEKLYESPYTEFGPLGPENLFVEDTVNRLFAVVDRFGGQNFLHQGTLSGKLRKSDNQSSDSWPHLRASVR